MRASKARRIRAEILDAKSKPFFDLIWPSVLASNRLRRLVFNAEYERRMGRVPAPVRYY